MHPRLQELHKDHTNFARILALLEKQLGLVRQGNSADLYILSEIVDYMQSYPDLLHHPREDIIFNVYMERTSREKEQIETLMREHRQLLDRTKSLREYLDQWELDYPLPRDAIADLIDDYLRAQWDHLNLEEGTMYKILSEELTPEDWDRIEASMPSGSDPLFGDLIRQRYENLFELLFEYA